MKSICIRSAVCVAGLMTSLPALAQSGPMRAPMLPQAIEMQMQQRRTLEQREAIDAQKASPLQAGEAASGKGDKSPKRSAAKQSGKAAKRAVPVPDAASGNAN